MREEGRRGGEEGGKRGRSGQKNLMGSSVNPVAVEHVAHHLNVASVMARKSIHSELKEEVPELDPAMELRDANAVNQNLGH